MTAGLDRAVCSVRTSRRVPIVRTYMRHYEERADAGATCECDGTSIQDIKHYLLHCPTHDREREHMHNTIHAACPNEHARPALTLKFLLNNRGTHKQVEAVEKALFQHVKDTMGGPI